MTIVVDKVAEGFGKSLGERAATVLGEWIERLWNAERVAKRQQLEKIVEPAFAQFHQIYEEYESSFQQYRRELADADSQDQIIGLVDRIKGDLRFTARNRVDLLAHLNHATDSLFGGFVRSMIEFLVCNEQSSSGKPEDSLAPTEIASQVYRRALIADLQAVTAPWAAALDPEASSPPLQGPQLERALDEIAKRHGIAKTDPKRDGKLRARLAVERLDARMDSMVSAYKKVRVEYEALKATLST
jgi:hypothetical protein